MAAAGGVQGRWHEAQLASAVVARGGLSVPMDGLGRLIHIFLFFVFFYAINCCR